MIWPDGESPSRENTVLVDPCFSEAGYAQATAALEELGVVVDVIETDRPQLYAASIEEFAEAGYDMIVTGAALAVIPVMILNVRRFREEESIR